MICRLIEMVWEDLVLHTVDFALSVILGLKISPQGMVSSPCLLLSFTMMIMRMIEGSCFKIV